VICDQMSFFGKKMKTNFEVVKEDKIQGTCRIGGKQLMIINLDRKYQENIVNAID
jgi:hypothetical protein